MVSPSSPSTADVTAEGKKRLLLVDDEFDSVDMLAMLFVVHGFDVDIAQNGQEALDQVQRQLPDLIITDLHMPFVNGLDLCSKLKQVPRTAAIPIILLSGGALAHELSAVPYDLFLRKPVGFATLLEAVAKLL